MRKTLIVFVLLFLSYFSYSQIRVVENSKSIIVGKVGGASMSPFVASLEYLKGDADVNQYTLLYNNLKYSTITDINVLSFAATESDILGLYDLLVKCFDAEKGSEKTVELGKETVWIKTIKNLGVVSLQITTSDDGTLGYFYMTKKQLDKLFGK